MENNTKRRMLTIGEAARLIEGITEYRIRQMCKSGQLRSFKAGNKFLIAEDDLYEAVFGKTSAQESGGAAAARCSKETAQSVQDARI